MSSVPKPTGDAERLRTLNFINGEFVAAKSGKTFENRSPSSGPAQ